MTESPVESSSQILGGTAALRGAVSDGHAADRSGEAPPKGRIWSWVWKAYAWFLALVALVALLVIPFSPSLPLALVDVVVSAVCVAGVFGFTYRRRLLTVRFWRIWLPSVLSWELLYNFGFIAPLVGAEHGASAGIAAGSILMLAGLPIVLPAYVALYRYAFATKELWAGAGPAGPPLATASP